MLNVFFELHEASGTILTRRATAHCLILSLVTSPISQAVQLLAISSWSIGKSCKDGEVARAGRQSWQKIKREKTETFLKKCGRVAQSSPTVLLDTA